MKDSDLISDHFSTRFSNCLIEAKMGTVGELKSFIESNKGEDGKHSWRVQLFSIPNFGRVCMQELEKTLNLRRPKKEKPSPEELAKRDGFAIAILQKIISSDNCNSQDLAKIAVMQADLLIKELDKWTTN